MRTIITSAMIVLNPLLERISEPRRIIPTNGLLGKPKGECYRVLSGREYYPGLKPLNQKSETISEGRSESRDQSGINL